MKFKDIQKKEIVDLDKEIVAKKRALFEFHNSSSGAKTRNVKEAQNLRKDIARILTEKRNRNNKA